MKVPNKFSKYFIGVNASFFSAPKLPGARYLLKKLRAYVVNHENISIANKVVRTEIIDEKFENFDKKL